MLDKISICLDEYLRYDWQAFNALGMNEQCVEWTRLETQFYELVQAEYKAGSFDFEKVYALIKSYKFKNLPIEGKLYIRVHKWLLKGQLLGIVEELEYQEVKRKENPPCSCEIRSRFGKSPKTEGLKETGTINDGYYMPTIFKCRKCDFLWISYTSDDSTGLTRFEKYEPEDDSLITYRAH